MAKFNKWDYMMCLSNVNFFLDDITKQYVNHQDTLNFCGKFKARLSELFGNHPKYTRKAKEQLK